MPRNFRDIEARRHRCSVCTKPFATRAGRNRHHTICHRDDSRAERAFDICMMVLEGGCSRSEAAEAFNVDYQVVHRIISNWLAWPNYYALDPRHTEMDTKVLSFPEALKRRRA